ncbi:MAG: hypothetical protein ACYSWU_06120 [Planctomycetota bacterium]|jgi:hypothetical protein
MGTSFTEFKGRGFWARDSSIEFWLWLLAQEIDRRDEVAGWLAEAREHWHVQATEGFTGCVDASLDEYLTSPERVQTVLGLAERALDGLQGRGAVLSADWLNSLGIGGQGARFGEDVPTEVFARVGEAFIKLLREELPWDAKWSPVL